MKVLLKVVLSIVCAATLGYAQVQNETTVPNAPVVVNTPEQPAEAKAPAAENLKTAPQTPAAAAPVPANAGETLAPAADSPKAAGTPKAPASTKAGDAPKAGEVAKDYIIGPLDVVIVKVWNNPNLSGAVDVGSDGMISLPLIGDVKADGLTVRQLRETLTERFKELINNPDVNVQMGKVNSKRYFVYGGVGRGGEFALVRDTTVMDALSNVGGFRDFANTKKIRIQRGTKEFLFNYKDVSKGKHLEQNILLENGDRIFVPE